MTFLYDIGKVLLDFDFETSLVGLLPAGHPAPQDALAKLLLKKDDFEAGRIPHHDFIPWALETLESSASHDDFVHAWRNIFTPNLPMWETVKKLAADKHTLILFSNTNPIHCPWIFKQYPDFSLFSGSVLSYHFGSVKPRPDIYRHAIQSHNLIPGETFYIDDMPQNIETGRKLGFNCHQYEITDHPAFESWLARHLALNKS